jgi:predicted nuclease of predicted toxin-antitoxin system
VRLLLDENFPKAAADTLRQQGHDVLWIRTHAPGLNDKRVLQLAAQQERLVLTLDKDFFQLSCQLGKLSLANYGIILFRLHPAIPDRVVKIVTKTLGLELDWVGHVSVVSETSVQMFPLRVR